MPVDWLKAEWKRRKLLGTVHLTISGCLGPCDLCNVVCLVTSSGLTWLGGLTLEEEYRALLEWATRSAGAGYLFPLPAAFEERIFETPFLPGEHAVPAGPSASVSPSPGSEPVAWQG